METDTASVNPLAQIPILVQGQGPEHAKVVLKLKKRKPARPPSMVWRHFTKKKDTAFCNYCFTSFVSNGSNHRTNNMLKTHDDLSKNMKVNNILTCYDGIS